MRNGTDRYTSRCGGNMEQQHLTYLMIWIGLALLTTQLFRWAYIRTHVCNQENFRYRNSRSGIGPGPRPGGWSPPAPALDPVCCKTVDTAVSNSSFYQGSVYYFCSPRCRKGFELTPENFVAPIRLTQAVTPKRGQMPTLL